MSKDIVKANALINASYSLTLAEQRLILLAIIEVRKHRDSKNYNQRLHIPASSYAQEFNTEINAAYAALQSASNQLFERRFTSVEENEHGLEYVKKRWVTEISYINNAAIVGLTFHEHVIPLITELEKCFTSYPLRHVTELNAYSIRLYEIIIAWRSAGKMPPIKLDELKERLGIAPNEYQRLHHFKARVLEPSIEQINKFTDITVSYENVKEGRTVTGIAFKFKVKKEHLAPKPLTPAQAQKYAALLANMPELGSRAPIGASAQTFAAILADDLKNPDKLPALLPYLEKAGYKTK